MLSGIPLAVSIAGAVCIAAAPTAVAQPAASVERLAGQSIVWSFSGTQPPPWIMNGIRRGEIGSILLFSSNGTSATTVRRLTRRLQGARPKGDPPLLIMSDHEGGPVRRIKAEPRLGGRQLGRLPVRASTRAGNQAGQVLCHAGVNVNLAPVVDLVHPGSVIGAQGRGFGRGVNAVTRRAYAFAHAQEQHGVMAAPKHFPGFGAATQTTDDVPVRIVRPLARMRAQDMRPFEVLFRRGVTMVMVSTARYSAWPGAPAALSRRVVVGELRNRMGFTGVVVADALDTPALAAVAGHPQVAVRARQAGVDLLPFIGPRAARQARTGIVRALENGTLNRAEAQASLARVLSYRRALAANAGTTVSRRLCGT